MWKFIVDIVHDLRSSLRPDVGRGFLHVSNVFLYSGGGSSTGASTGKVLDLDRGTNGRVQL